ncbi:MAG: hypothetical protein JSV49_09530 [Thermoplasmata archaeon]|nr:MAG: hypothetical protein JSV49_09530 [Thermoplasmata archaeon]
MNIRLHSKAIIFKISGTLLIIVLSQISQIVSGQSNHPVENQENEEIIKEEPRGDVFFDIFKIFSSFPERDFFGRPAVREEHFDRRSDSFKGPWVIRVPVYEDVQDSEPIPVSNAKIFLNISGSYFLNTSVSMTNTDGVAIFKFTHPLRDHDYPDREKLLYKKKVAYDLSVNITFVGKSGLRSSSISFNMTYYPTPPPRIHRDYESSRFELCFFTFVIITTHVFFFIVYNMFKNRKNVNSKTIPVNIYPCPFCNNKISFLPDCRNCYCIYYRNYT